MRSRNDVDMQIRSGPWCVRGVRGGGKNNHKKVGDSGEICTLSGTPPSYPFCFLCPPCRPSHSPASQPNLHLKRVLAPPHHSAPSARLKCRFGGGSSWAVGECVWVRGACWVGDLQLPWRSHRICISSAFWVLLGVAQLEQRRHANSVGTMVSERGERGRQKQS